MPSDMPVATDASSAICMKVDSNMAVSTAHDQRSPARNDAEMHRNTVQRSQAILSKHVVHRPLKNDVVAHQHDGGGETQHDRQQMRDVHDRDAAQPIQITQEPDHRSLAGDVHAYRWLIEHEHILLT